MRAAGSALVSVAVIPWLKRPYFGLRGKYLVTVKRRPHDLVPTDGACSVAARMSAWLRASAVSAMVARSASVRARLASARAPASRRSRAATRKAVPAATAAAVTQPASATTAPRERRRAARRRRAPSARSASSSRGSITIACPQSVSITRQQSGPRGVPRPAQSACRAPRRGVRGRKRAAFPAESPARAVAAATASAAGGVPQPRTSCAAARRGCDLLRGGRVSAVEEVEPLGGGEVGAQRRVVGGGEGAERRVAARAPEDRRVGKAAAVEVQALQVAYENLRGLRVLELVDEPHEIGEPFAVHAARRDQPLAEGEERLRIEAGPGAELERRHDQLVGDRAGDAVGGREHHVVVLLEEAGHLERREVLAVLADPVVRTPVEEEKARAVAHDDVPEVARVIDPVAVLGLVGCGVVEVALEEARVRRLAADLAHRLGVVGDLAVGTEQRRGTLPAALVEHLDGRVGDRAHAAARVALAAKRADRRLGGAVELEHLQIGRAH